MLIQNTGMMESGDSIRGMALDAGFPLVMVIGYRGWTRRGVIRDSVAKYTEPFLNAFGINYYLVEQNEDGDRISIAFEEARASKGPVAVPGRRRVPRLQQNSPTHLKLKPPRSPP